MLGRYLKAVSCLALVAAGACTRSESPRITPPARFYGKSFQAVQQLGNVEEIRVSVSLPGVGEMTIFSVVKPQAPFSFKGGEYPGEGGTCGMSVSEACTVVFEFAPQSVGHFKSTAQLLYKDETGAESTYQIQLSGDGALAVGQPDLESNARHGIKLPVSIFQVAGKWFLVDFGNNRVLIYDRFPHPGDRPLVVLGQPTLTSRLPNNGGISARSLSGPWSVWSDGQKLFISDRGNNRVLGWKTFPTEHFQAADFVLGQPSFTTNTATATRATSLRAPQQITSDGTRLYVCDTGNHRVVVWDALPVAGVGADWAIGQSTLDSGAVNAGVGAVNDAGFSSPVSLAVQSHDLWIVDQANHRVLRFADTKTTLPHATLVLGQTDFTGNTVQPGAGGLSTPTAVAASATHLFVSDLNHFRILVWSPLPTTNKAPAQFALGQPNLTSISMSGRNPAADTLWEPHALYVQQNQRRLYVADRANNRVLGWQDFPTQNGAAADRFYGQPTLSSNVENNDQQDLEGAMGRSLNSDSDGVKFLITDMTQHRVLIWNQLPSHGNQEPSIILGQSGAMSYNPNTGGLARGLFQPRSAKLVNGMLFVADGNNRVVFWNQVPTENHAIPDGVLGQANLMQNRANRGATLPTSTSLATPTAMAYDGTRFFLADGNNHRVLVYNGIPTSAETEPMLVLGQENFTSKTVNAGGPGVNAKGMNFPTCVQSNGVHVIVCDSANHRVLVWKVEGLASGQNAFAVIGQATFTTRLARTGNNGFNLPTGATFGNGKLYVIDSNNSRILVWNTVPLQGQPADEVLGQPDFVSNTPGIGPQKFSLPYGLSFADGKLLVVDSYNDRTLVFVPRPAEAAAASGGPIDF